MVKVKQGKVSLFVNSVNILGDVAVSICFNANLKGCVLSRLNGSGNCDCLPEGTEDACAAYALYLAVEDKLCGNPLATKQSKVGKVQVGQHNGCLFFTWNMKGTVSHVRKSISMAISALKPGSLYSLYGHCMRKLGVKLVREHFNSAANKLLSGINQGIDCCIIGKIKLGKTAEEEKKKASDMLQKISNKLSPGSVATPRVESKEGSACDHKNTTELKVSGWQASVVKDYIMSKARGVEPIICNKSLLIPMKESTYEVVKAKWKNQLSLFVQQKYKKLGNECGPVLAYLAVSNAALSCEDAEKLCNASAATIESAIRNNL